MADTTLEQAQARATDSTQLASARAQAALSACLLDAPRIARIGEWPDWVTVSSLSERIPTQDVPASGFDAGVACALGMIPTMYQELSCRLHAAYTPSAVAHARADVAILESALPDALSETCWWLAACDVCIETDLDELCFAHQIDEFAALAVAPDARIRAARHAVDEMRSSYQLGKYQLADDTPVPLSIRDGGMQGAYLAGFDVAAAFDAADELFFVGTFHPSLGLESFTWRELPDPAAPDIASRRGRSGPVHGSRQYVKCCDEAELARVLTAVNIGNHM